MNLEKMVMKEMVERQIKEPQILTIDIETSPHTGYFWGHKWQTGILEFIEYGQIIGFSAKWLKGNQITKTLIDYKDYRPGKMNDQKIVKDIHKLIEKADILIGHNIKDFDMRYINSRFLKHNLNPPTTYKLIDTKTEAKRIMKLSSYKLDDLGDYLSIGNKMQHEGFSMWLKCREGDKKAWNRMKKYNHQDTILTEKLYLKLRPYMNNHPSLTIYSEKEGCPTCTSDHVQRRGVYVTKVNKFPRYQCQDCGHWYRGSKSLKIDKKPDSNI